MFAVLKSGGKQYKVVNDDKILIEKIDGNIGDEIIFKDVLMIDDNGNSNFGSPLLDDAAVVAEVLKQTRGPKITIIYKRRRKNSRRKQGHKQDLTLVKIKKIAKTGGSKIVLRKADTKKNLTIDPSTKNIKKSVTNKKTMKNSKKTKVKDQTKTKNIEKNSKKQ